MSKQSERERFLIQASEAGLPYDVARKVLRYAATIQRLAEAQCNGDWPCDNGERKVKACPKCAGLWAPSVFRRELCPDCRHENLMRVALLPYGLEPVFQGDPRGWCVRILRPTDRRGDSYTDGIGVPA